MLQDHFAKVNTNQKNCNCDKLLVSYHTIVSLPNKSYQLSQFYKTHYIWPHCWATVVRQYHSILKSHHRHVNGRYRRHFKLIGSTTKAMRRLQQQQQRLKRMKHTPPISCKSLDELSLCNLFQSIQLRHDLLFDPHLSFRPNHDRRLGREKWSKAEHYWKQLHVAFQHPQQKTSFIWIKVMIQELARILVSLIRPFEDLPISGASFCWGWPAQVTAEEVYQVLDPQLILQKLKPGIVFQMESQVNWLIYILSALCPSNSQDQLGLIRYYFSQKKYANALKQCFQLLEIIKLDCANRVLRHYRHYLLTTCASLEYKCFINQYISIETVVQWLKGSWQRNPEQPYYAGLVHLVTDDEEMIRALQLPSLPFPVTLKFDQKRLINQFRYDFQHMMWIAIVMTAYRHLNNVVIKTTTNLACFKQQLKEIKSVSFGQLSQILCQDKNEVMFWEAWLSHNLKPSSILFQLIYRRICQQLIYITQHGYRYSTNISSSSSSSSSQPLGIEQEIETLGKKLKMVADLNLNAFSGLYKSIVLYSCEKQQ